MKIFLKRESVASPSDVDGVLGEMKKLQDTTESLFLELSGAQRVLQSRSEKILELSNRLRHGAHPVREKERLEGDLKRLQDTKELEQKVELKKKEYNTARAKLKELMDAFNKSYLQVDIPEQK